MSGAAMTSMHGHQRATAPHLLRPAVDMAGHDQRTDARAMPAEMCEVAFAVMRALSAMVRRDG